MLTICESVVERRSSTANFTCLKSNRMSVAVLITEERECAQIIPWGILIAEARETDLQIILPKRSTRKHGWNDITPDDAETATEKEILKLIARPSSVAEPVITENGNSHDQDAASVDVNIRARRYISAEPGQELVEQIRDQSVKLLIIPAFSLTRASGEGSEWQGVLLKQAPCDTLLIRDDAQQHSGEFRVLTVVMNNPDDRIALQHAAELTTYFGGSQSAVYVEPNIDEFATDVGQRILERILSNALGRKSKDVHGRVVLGDTVADGLKKIRPEEFDLILAGTRREKDISRILFAPLFDGKEAEGQIPALATIRQGQRLSGKVRSILERFSERYIPQLDRDQRVALVERVQASSQWDFDFVALICLSTLIAGLGLIRNSVAVVIGAMLVAPLMTPIVGAGLGLAQCNLRLIQVSFRTIYRGFATAFCIGLLLGWLACDEIVPEMTARGLPNFLDLLVALASGIAAAYALGRPNLSSALPGVAIAAALVPPLATSGIAAAEAEWKLAWGALLLFATNIVAIVLGTTGVFSAVGIRRVGKTDSRAPAWPRWVLLALVMVTLVLTALIHYNNYPAGVVET